MLNIFKYFKRFTRNVTPERCECLNCEFSCNPNNGYMPCMGVDEHGLPIVKNPPPVPNCKSPQEEQP